MAATDPAREAALQAFIEIEEKRNPGTRFLPVDEDDESGDKAGEG